MHTSWIYVNGRIVPTDEAQLSPLDIGLLRGYAVFDLLRTVNGRPFMLAEHLQRLRTSADHLGLTVPVSDEEIAAAIDTLLERNAHAEATVRLVLTGGVSPDGMSFDAATPTFIIMTHEFVEPPAEVYALGGRLVTEHHRREVPAAKTTNYLTKLRHAARVQREGALDLLYHDGEIVSEAASASFYVVEGDAIVAPADDVLWGTVGSLVLELAQERYRVMRRALSLDDVREADEAFLTSTTRGVVPIVEIDGIAIGDGKVGPVTRELMRMFARAAFGEETS